MLDCFPSILASNSHFLTSTVWYCPRIVSRIECSLPDQGRPRRETYDTFRSRGRASTMAHAYFASLRSVRLEPDRDEEHQVELGERVVCDFAWGRHTQESRPPTGDKGTEFTNRHVSARRAQCCESSLLCSTEAHRSNLVVQQRSNTDVRSDTRCVGLLGAGARTRATWTDLERFPMLIMLESSRPFWIKAGELTADSAISKSRPGDSSYGALHYARLTSACVGSS